MPPADWRLFVNNAYLLPPFAVNADNATCTRQDERAAALAALAAGSQADAVFLQETWGAAQGPLEAGLRAAGYEVDPACRTWFGSTLVDSALQHWRARGGLYAAVRCSVGVEARWPSLWGSYASSQTKSKKGFCATLLSKKGQMGGEVLGDARGARGTSRDFGADAPRAAARLSQESAASINAHLLVINTHNDPLNVDNVQVRQLHDLAKFTRTAVEQAGVASFGAVIVGDFNCTPGSKVYRAIFDVFSEHNVQLVELLPPSARRTPTYARDNELVMWKEDAGRLDHIFAVRSVDGRPLASVSLSREMVHSSARVSDHYPFEVDLRVGA